MKVIVCLSLLILGVECGNGSVPCASRDRVELEVLLERATLGRGVREPLFLQVDTHVVEHRHQNHVEGEGDSRHADFGSVPTPGSRETENDGRDHVICSMLVDD